MKKFLSLLGVAGLVFAFGGCSFLNDEEEVLEPEVVEEEIADEDVVALQEKIAKLETELEGEDEAEAEVGAEVSVESEVSVEDLQKRIEELEKALEAEKAVVEPAEKADEPDEERPSSTPLIYDGPNFITLTSPKNEETFTVDISAGDSGKIITFKGVVAPTTTKIVVSAKGGDPLCNEFADGPCFERYFEDVYKLQQFKYGDENFTYRASFKYENLTWGTNEYEFTAYFDDGTTRSANLTIFMVHVGAEMGKPVIYLYPQEPTVVSVNVEPTDGISVSEPEIGDGWNVLAAPDGTLYNLRDAAVYPYLFWEGFAANFVTPEEGFVVEGDDVEAFFDEKLAVLGLNEKEVADFKEFWVPRLSDAPYYFVTFIDQEDFDRYAPLSVSPAPDSMIRVFFDYKALETPVEVVEQVLETPERNGFTVVEWGGRLY